MPMGIFNLLIPTLIPEIVKISLQKLAYIFTILKIVCIFANIFHYG